MIGLAGLRDQLVSHALASGYFTSVNEHEAVSPPPRGPSASVWLQNVAPIPERSGQTSTSLRIEMNVRLHLPMPNGKSADGLDAVDTELLTVGDALMSAYTADYELGGLAAEVDLLGQYGSPMGAVAGYLTQGDVLFRILLITVPIVLNDVWVQAP